MPTKAQGKQLTPSGRPASWGVRIRERIDASKAVTQLNDCIAGNVELSQAQVSMIRLALDKTVPTLKAIEVQSNQQHRDIKDIPTDVFMDILEGQAKRVK